MSDGPVAAFMSSHGVFAFTLALRSCPTRHPTVCGIGPGRNRKQSRVPPYGTRRSFSFRARGPSVGSILSRRGTKTHCQTVRSTLGRCHEGGVASTGQAHDLTGEFVSDTAIAIKHHRHEHDYLSTDRTLAGTSADARQRRCAGSGGTAVPFTGDLPVRAVVRHKKTLMCCRYRCVGTIVLLPLVRLLAKAAEDGTDVVSRITALQTSGTWSGTPYSSRWLDPHRVVCGTTLAIATAHVPHWARFAVDPSDHPPRHSHRRGNNRLRLPASPRRRVHQRAAPRDADLQPPQRRFRSTYSRSNGS